MCVEGEAMRTFPLLAAAASLVVAATPLGAATRNFGVTSFEKVRVDGPYKVKLATGVAPFARVMGSPAAADRVAIEMLGNTLVIHPSASSWGGDPRNDPGPVEIEIGTHDLAQVYVNGSGSISIDRVKGLSFGLTLQGSGLASIDAADVDQLKVNLVGNSSAKLAGRAGQMTAVIRGISTLDAANLSVKDATLGVEGTSTAGANVSNSVTVDASGPANVKLDGRPSCTLHVRGSATVSGCASSSMN